MAGPAPHPTTGWHGIDRAAFGLVYGAITVLSLLMAMGDHPEAPYETAAILFGSVLAVTLAKAFAELLAHALDTGERLTRGAWRAAWRHSAPTLAVANLPTLLFVAAGLGWLRVEAAGGLAQGVCVLVLMLVGARVGWVIDRRPLPAIGGAFFAGGIGAALALMKFVIH
ncbi:hypothetical protein [Roseicyclus persicicus]|uniref:Uncharacterized protein n=1 Tax=Roseicyclus persicicus TaxID=2650661 RepID=A0A7X6GVS5_9RHOB|nr:hypothetical protein [Roseibacterium persicicum]NKX43295.1 hypothetical protein [Roseibacterium persicicum]